MQTHTIPLILQDAAAQMLRKKNREETYLLQGVNFWLLENIIDDQLHKQQAKHEPYLKSART
jgi:hypothetical protein